uniref:Metalloendopeptidase OMA1, mitochondrial n=1 Tax=Macrostomum lignano TaxID=282301 RepID=A0A1I8IMA1_9PLAT
KLQLSTLSRHMRWRLAPTQPQHQLRQLKKLFHTSTTNRAPPVLVVVLMKPLLKMATALTARVARRKWSKFKPETKEKYLAYLSARRRLLIGGGISCCVGCLGYYAWHLERAPFTGRLRVVTISTERLNEYSRLGLNALLEDVLKEGAVYTSEHPYTRRVAEIIESLLPAAEKMFPDFYCRWRVCVIEDDETVNAMCFSTGDILVYSGMLKFVENDHQLAFILAHELAHVFIGHSRESVTIGNAVYTLVLLPLTALTWLFVPDIVAAFGYAIQVLLCLRIFEILNITAEVRSPLQQDHLISIFFDMPFSRRLELEADAVGLEIASASCYDPREAARFWELMDYMEEAKEVAEFLSTHPLSADRASVLRGLQDRAIATRASCGCVPLGQRAQSPADSVYDLLRRGMQGLRNRFSGSHGNETDVSKNKRA